MTNTTVSPSAFLYAPDFLKTNRIFTDGNRKLIRQHLDHAEATLLDIVDRGIQGLSRQERELADCIERCKVALAPIKNLPDDVLQYIFIICCDSPTEFLSHDPKPPVSTLCQVCSAWRSLALETPVLWSQISLYYDRSFVHAHIPSYVEGAVKLWFARASTCPIFLEAGVNSSSSLAQEEELSDLVGRIIALPSHYRKLVLHFYRKNLDVLLGKLSPDQIWHLEELETINFRRSLNAEGSLLPFSPTAPFSNLKKLVDAGYWHSNNLSKVIPLSHLQVLNIQATTIIMSVALELFQQCPLLETCEIMVERSDSTIRSQLANRTSYTTLPQLRDLWMRFDSTEDCCRFIDQLVLSNLQSLTIDASNYYETTFHPSTLANHVAALSQRSGTPNIRQLNFNRMLASILDPGILLRSLPHLENLVTYGCVALDDGTLDGLAIGTIGRCLGYIYADDIEADLGAITRMAKQRAQNVGLNKLRVTTSKSVLGESGWGDWTGVP